MIVQPCFESLNIFRTDFAQSNDFSRIACSMLFLTIQNIFVATNDSDLVIVELNLREIVTLTHHI